MLEFNSPANNLMNKQQQEQHSLQEQYKKVLP